MGDDEVKAVQAALIAGKSELDDVLGEFTMTDWTGSDGNEDSWPGVEGGEDAEEERQVDPDFAEPIGDEELQAYLEMEEKAEAEWYGEMEEEETGTHWRMIPVEEAKEDPAMEVVAVRTVQAVCGDR